MRKKVLFFLFFNIISLFIINSNENLINKINKLAKNTNLKLLLKYPSNILISPSERYFLVYAIGCELLEDEEKLKENALKENIEINSFKFFKGEYQWWFIFDTKIKKIVIKGSNLALIGNIGWIEDKSIFYFDLGTSPTRKIIFYKLDDMKNKEFFKITATGMHDIKLFEFSDNLKFIAYHVTNKYDELFGEDMPLTLSIIIKNIELNKEIIKIVPKNNNSFEIVKWKSNNKLIYKELDENKKSIKELSYIIK